MIYILIFMGNLDGLNTLAHEKREWEEGGQSLMTACYMYVYRLQNLLFRVYRRGYRTLCK